MDWKTEWKPLLWITGIFLTLYYLPVGAPRFDNAIMESLYLVKWYAREHVLLCLIPAFFIAGAIAVFISEASVMKYLGPSANKIIAYGVSSVSGSILAVCSCTILPLFAGIHRMGAGLGPATTFLYSGPAINVLAIILTARILGLKLGLARAIGAIVFSIVIGALMSFIFRKDEINSTNSFIQMPQQEVARPLWQNTVYFGLMVIILVFANWAKPHTTSGIWYDLYLIKWLIVSVSALLLGIILVLWFNVKMWKILITSLVVITLGFIFSDLPAISFTVAILGLSIITITEKGEAGEWFEQTWGFAKQILPLLLFGVLIAGALLGRPGGEGIIPSYWISSIVGGNSFTANLFASVVGAFMYFATLTEIPILQGLIANGMGNGPALALLLAGPALSLPNMLVIQSVLGIKKTVIFIILVVVMSTICGMIYGALF